MFTTNQNYNVIEFKKIKLENLGSDLSQSSGRSVTNSNFIKVQNLLNEISKVLNQSILLPNPEKANSNYEYIIKFDGNNFFIDQVLTGQLNERPFGIKFHLRDGDDILVKKDYQYIVYNDLIIDPGANLTLEVGAELVIL
jgi:hypothetical protein